MGFPPEPQHRATTPAGQDRGQAEQLAYSRSSRSDGSGEAFRTSREIGPRCVGRHFVVKGAASPVDPTLVHIGRSKPRHSADAAMLWCRAPARGSRVNRSPARLNLRVVPLQFDLSLGWVGGALYI